VSSLLLLSLALAAQVAPGDAPSTWVEPEASTLKRVFGVRYTRDYSEFQLLQTNAEEWTQPLISADRARVYIGTRSGVLEALDLATGDSLWKRRDMGAIGWGLAEHRGYVLLGSDSSLVAVDQQLGRDHWKVELDGKLAAGLAVTGTVALAAIRPNAVVAVDLVKGKVLWRVKRPTPDGITVRGQCAPTIDERLNRAYLGFSDGTVVAVDIATGKTVWLATLGIRRDFFADVDAQPILVDSGKALITASYNGGLFKLDTETGKEIWKQDLKRISALSQAEPGLLMATLGNGQVAGIYAANGKVRWRYKAKKGYPTRVVPVGHGLVAFGVSQGPMTVLDVGTGRPVQLLTPGSGGVSVPPAHEGSDLVLLTNKGMLLVLRHGEGVGAARAR